MREKIPGKITFYLAVFLIAIAPLMLVSMGAAPGEFPSPKVDFKAVVIDVNNVETRCNSLSWDGAVSIKANRGSGIVIIPFESIKKVSFTHIPAEKKSEAIVKLHVTLRSGETVDVTAKSRTWLYGKTSFGNYKVLVSELKEVVFD
jgi:hypothetical protein